MAALLLAGALDGTGAVQAQAPAEPQPGAQLAPTGPLDGPRELDLVWRIRAGDDPAWADPLLEDAGWQRAAPFTPWRALDPPPRQRAWARLRLKVPPDQPIAVGLWRVFDAAELYADGRLLARHGDPARGRAGLAGPFTAAVPAELSADGEILIALRVWGGADPAEDGMLSAILVGPAAVLPDFVRSARADRWRSAEGVPALLLGLVLIGLGLLHLYIAVARREAPQAYFGLAALCLGLQRSWRAAEFLELVAPSRQYTFASPLLRCLAYALLLLFGAAFLNLSRRRWPQALALGLVVIGLVAAIRLVPWWPSALFVGQGLAAIAAAIMLLHGLRRRLPGTVLMLVGFLPMIAWGLLDAADFLLGVEAYRPWRPYAALAAIFAFMFATSVALAQRLITTLSELDRTWQASYRFVPMAFLRLLGRDTITQVERGDSSALEMTVMFCDIRGFTARSEGRPPAESFGFINDFLERMLPCIEAHEGFLAHFLGDGFLALFPKGSSRPVAAAVAMQRALVPLNARLEAEGEPPVRIGIGLHSGAVMLGTIGGGDRLDTNVVSDVVNTAARVEGLSKLYDAPIVITQDTRALLPRDGFLLAPLDFVAVQGRSAPVAVFEVLDGEVDEALRRAKADQRQVYAAGLAAFRAGSLAAARAAFETLLPRPAARLFLERCDWAEQNGLPEGWDGVWRLSVK